MNAYIEIQADDCARAVAFYEGVLGWKFAKDESVPIEYWRIDAGQGGRGGGILKRPAPRPPMHSGTNAFVCSFEVSDFDAVARMAIEKGGMVAMDKFAVPGVCWQGYFLDTEGNTFGIFQPDPNAA